MKATELIVYVLGSGVGGGIISIFVKNKVDRKKDQSEIIKNTAEADLNSADFAKRVQEVYSDLSKDLIKKYEEIKHSQSNLSAKYEQVHKENKILKDKIAKLHATILRHRVIPNGLPFPFWMRDGEGIVTYINSTYETVVLEPLGFKKEDLIGTKGEIFGEEFCAKMLENSMRVQRTGTTIAFEETVDGLGPGKSYKFPIDNEKGVVERSGGIWIPKDLTLIDL